MAAPRKTNAPNGSAQSSDDQTAFVAALLDPEAPTPPCVGPGQNRRFDVYRNNVIAGLLEALGDAYPAVKSLVGAPFFSAAGALYVRAHPPKSPLMFEYGDGFADWLEAFEPAAELPYLPDVARLERLLLEARNAADADVLDAAGFSAAAQGLAPEALAQMALSPHPAARALTSRFPIVSIRERALSGGEGALNGGQTALITRPDDAALAIIAPPTTDLALETLANGAPLGSAAERVAEEGGDFGAVLSALLEHGALRSARSQIT